MKVLFSFASSEGDVQRCGSFVRLWYQRSYHIEFADNLFDIKNHIEPYPDYYLMAEYEGEVVGVLGVYLQRCTISRAGFPVECYFSELSVVEHTKLTVAKPWRHRGLASSLIRLGLSKSFLKICGSPDIIAYNSVGDLFLKIHDKLSIPHHSLTIDAHDPDYCSMQQAYFSDDNPCQYRFVQVSEIPLWIFNQAMPERVYA